MVTENTLLAKAKIINDCNGTITLNTEGEWNDPIIPKISYKEYVNNLLKQVKEDLNNFKSSSEPVTIDPIESCIKAIKDREIHDKE